MSTVINPIRVFPQSRLDIAGVNSALFSLLLRLFIGSLGTCDAFTKATGRLKECLTFNGYRFAQNFKGELNWELKMKLTRFARGSRSGRMFTLLARLLSLTSCSSAALHLTSYILHHTSYIIHLTSFNSQRLNGLSTLDL